MDSLRLTGTLSISGIATGRSGQPDNNTPVSVRLVAALTSSATGATKADDLLYYIARTLAPSTDETFDLTSFTSALTELGASLSKVRLYGVVHDADSVASSIRVGGAATPFPGMKDTAATTDTFAPGCGFAQIVPTTTGMPVTAGMGVKVANLDAVNIATYTIVVSGE